MLTNSKTTKKASTKKTLIQSKLSIVLILCILCLGLSVTHRYGVSWDEIHEINMIEWNFRAFMLKEPIPGDLRYYGTFFNGLAEIVFQLKQQIFAGFNLDLSQQDYLDLLREKFLVKHYVTFIFSLIAYLCVSSLVAILTQSKYAWIGVLLLPLFPRFWGHSFFNPKDIPFASLLILGTLVSAYSVNFVTHLILESPSDLKKLLLRGFYLGLTIGVTAGTRMGGIIVIFFFLGTYLLVNFRQKQNGLVLSVFLFFVALISYLTIVLLYPTSWDNPIGFIRETLLFHANHHWAGAVLFKGETVLASELPWHYLPSWLLISTPVVLIALFVLGTVILIRRYTTLSILQRAALILLYIQILFFPIVAIVKKSTIYDGVRHFLFIFPAMAVICSVCIIQIIQAINRRRNRKTLHIVFISCLVISTFPIITDMMALHPYEYIYFNRVSGGLANAKGRYETEYWGLSLREAVEWLNQHVEVHDIKTQPVVMISGPFEAAAAFSSPKLAILPAEFFSRPENQQLLSKQDEFYYIAIPRGLSQEQFPDCKVIYQVERMEIPLSTVQHCSQTH